MTKFKNYILFPILFLTSSLYAQSNEELAKSYFLQAQEAYGNGNTQSAISLLDNSVKLLGKTNSKIEAFYLEVKRNNKHNFVYYYALENKQHLDNYLSMASTDRPEYEDVIRLAENVKLCSEIYKKNVTEAMQANLKRNWEESGPILVDGVGYFNSNGKLAFESNLKGGNQFRDGYALIKEFSSDLRIVKYYLINVNGEKFSKTKYDFIYRVGEGIYLTILDPTDDERYYGLINTKKNIELKTPNFISNKIEQFQNNGVAVFSVSTKQGDDKGLINKNGEIILEANYARITPFKNGLATAYGYITSNGKGVRVLRSIKSDGTIIYENKSGYSIGHYNFGGIVSFRNDKYGYLKNGQVIIPVQYDYAGAFSEGLAIVRKKSDFLIINEQNKQVGNINKEFGLMYSEYKMRLGKYQLFKNGMTVLENKKRDGFFTIDKYGKAITDDIICKSLLIISEKTLLARDNISLNYYLINLNSNKTTDLNTTSNLNIKFISEFNYGLALFSIENDVRGLPDLYGYIDVEGNIIVDPLYYDGEPYNDDKAIVYDKYFNKIVINPFNK
ncbi:WG repeat-containing protein [Tenacibaculum bernardetii]|uniref:WG repeat-containing protein n=1 Tax=Tenacibaculum bernardetii TaxID=3021375 RepID=UPI0023AEDC7E|nr:WG repeat-containing protein [Tenacibaculum bernardetii]